MAGCGTSGPASYVGTASNAALYVSWTRSGDTLYGQITEAQLSDDAASGKVTTDREGFTGTTDGSAVTLAIDGGLGSTVTGKLEAGQLVLSYPGADGGVTPVTLKRGGDTQYNTALAALRTRADQAQAAAQEAAQEDAAIQHGSDVAAAVQSAMNDLSEMADNATASSPDLYAADLQTVEAGLDTVKASYDIVRQAIDNGYSDSLCDAAANVTFDVKAMQRDIGVLHADRAKNRDTKSIAAAVKTLRDKFAELQTLDAQYIPTAAPTQSDVEASIAAAQAKVRTQGSQGADFTAANKLLAQAQAIKTKADSACQRVGN